MSPSSYLRIPFKPRHPLPHLSSQTLLTFPTAQIILVTLNRPASLNCISTSQHHELASIWDWMDNEPSIRCGIITGAGQKAFCAGADLKEWNESNNTGKKRSQPRSGFGGLSNRSRGKKPIIAAVNGLCLGGGFEMVINTDIVLASSSAVFGLPEVKIGVVAMAGALPRLVRTVGRQRAMECALTGKQYRAEEMKGWGLVNEVVEEDYNGGNNGDRGQEIQGRAEGYKGVVKRAIEIAETIAGNSPDSVMISKYGLELGWAGIGVEDGTANVTQVMKDKGVDGGENMKEGVRAFVERRRANWVDSKL
ncbi:MAG: hypothetical protein L6R38_004357 [Xanthoria sp. 2 TBL-2021]|nr:MAG: hypothetical protein L6R38_004357 [Xanthoria sp. 2 TBL-2021]